MSSNEYFAAADKVHNLIREFADHDPVVDTLRRGHTRLVNLARTKSIIKVASSQSDDVQIDAVKDVL